MAGDRKIYVKGVTYGSFRPDANGDAYPSPEVVAADFAAMGAVGVNTVRVYTVPPPWLLDEAQRNGLYLLVGIPWEQHVAFLGDRARERSIESRVREGVRACAGNAAVLGYAIGNEIPSSVVRWHGRRPVERFLERLYRAAKDEDPAALVTYANFPSTEYLQLSFVDFVCFNVFLEDEDKLDSYVARLQNIAGDRPLVLTELGLDSRRNGLARQMDSVAGQLGVAFAGGCAGAFVFSWTDDWHRGGSDVADWDFGLTDRARRGKPALAAVRDSFEAVPYPGRPWPRVSVVVCTRNGAKTLRDCLEGVGLLDYPDFESIVVDDGSSDDSAVIAEELGAFVLRTENNGLSAARNAGLAAATGEIIAYLDDDARPDPQWLKYLAATFASTKHAAVGGPNIAPRGEGSVAECVAATPGGPIHVLLSDRVAEHIPGCNMAFRRRSLIEVGGFDEQFRVAGDDVDICWRLSAHGLTIGFHPGAVVHHRRRGSVRAFFRQQRGYGRAEALLERKWPEKYNRGGHPTWGGHVYTGAGPSLLRRWQVYYGVQGSGLFQSAHEQRAGIVTALLRMPEWYLVVAAFAAVSALGLLWRPFFFALPFFALTASAAVAHALVAASRTPSVEQQRTLRGRVGRLLLTAFLHLVQPLARLLGRAAFGLTPWRRYGPIAFGWPLPREREVWTEHREEPDSWLAKIEVRSRRTGAVVRRGGPFERWDLRAHAGTLGSACVRMMVEEHGEGCQLARFRVWPRFRGAGAVAAVSALAAGGAALAGLPSVAVLAALFGAVVLVAAVGQAASSMTALITAFDAARVHERETLELALRSRIPAVAPVIGKVPAPVWPYAHESSG